MSDLVHYLMPRFCTAINSATAREIPDIDRGIGRYHGTASASDKLTEAMVPFARTRFLIFRER